MGKLIRVLVRCVLIVVVIEGLSFLALAAIALRKGYLSTYFSALWPHPAISRRAAQLAPQMYYLGVQAGLVGYGGGSAPGGFQWYPLLDHYRTAYPDGRVLRDHPTFHPKELGVYVIGGSVVEGGVVLAHLQEYLQAKLQDRYEVHVFNEGVGGYMSTHELVLLTTKILPFGNPRYVIALDGYNDWISTVYNLLNDFKGKTGVTEDVWPHAELSWFHYWFTEWQARKAIDTIPGASAQLAGVISRQILVHTYTGWLLNHVQTWRRFKQQLQHPFEYASVVDYYRTPVLPRARAELQVINARMMAETCRARGCRFFWALQPSLPCRGKAMTPEEQGIYGTVNEVYWNSLEHYYQDIREVVQEDAEFWTPRFLDLSCPAPDIVGPFFVDRAHLTGVGASRTAEHLAAVILEDLARHPPAGPRRETAALP